MVVWLGSAESLKQHIGSASSQSQCVQVWLSGLAGGRQQSQVTIFPWQLLWGMAGCRRRSWEPSELRMCWWAKGCCWCKQRRQIRLHSWEWAQEHKRQTALQQQSCSSSPKGPWILLWYSDCKGQNGNVLPALAETRNRWLEEGAENGFKSPRFFPSDGKER